MASCWYHFEAVSDRICRQARRLKNLAAVGSAVPCKGMREVDSRRMPAVGGLGFESVPDLADGQDVARRCRIGLELSAKLGHVRVDRSRDDGVGIAPDLPHQVQPRSDG